MSDQENSSGITSSEDNEFKESVDYLKDQLRKAHENLAEEKAAGLLLRSEIDMLNSRLQQVQADESHKRTSEVRKSASDLVVKKYDNIVNSIKQTHNVDLKTNLVGQVAFLILQEIYS